MDLKRFLKTVLITTSASMAMAGYASALQSQSAETDTIFEQEMRTLNAAAEGKKSTAEYWLSLSENNTFGVNMTDVWMTSEEITALNKEILTAEETAMYDLENMDETYDADQVKELLIKQKFPEDELYINEALIDGQGLKEILCSAIVSTGYSGEQKIQYAIVTTRADVKIWPVATPVGYSETDCDDEFMNTSLNVNEPFIIQAACTVDNQKFYWGYCSHYTGWVQADHVAICSTKEQWLDAWKVDVDGSDFLVVTQDKITLEKNLMDTAVSGVELMLGTILKTVPEGEVPESVGERGTWNNYVIYLPVQDENGYYSTHIATISQHDSISLGFLPMTSENVLNLAFSCLGDRYGWGGMLGSLDCSLYTRSVYRCFGLEIPRDAETQASIPGHIQNISNLSDEEKEAEIARLPAGSLLYFPGHVMIYLGTEDGINYVISAAGSLKAYKGAELTQQYSVIVTPLTVCRRNDSSWLSNIETLIFFAEA